MSTLSRRSATLILTAAAAAIAAAAPQTALEVKASGPKTLYANDRAGNNQVTFFSQSTLEDFTGVCNKVGGECTLDPKNVETFKGRFSVHVRDMKTGIDLRDQHMVGPEWLNADEHPEIVCDFTGVEDVKKTKANSAELTLVGKCTLHGVTKDVKIPASITWLDETPETMKRVKGDLLRIRAEFPVKLSDYGITGPEGSDMVGLKVSDTMEVRVSIFTSTERPPEDLAADKSADGKTPARRPPPRRSDGK